MASLTTAATVSGLAVFCSSSVKAEFSSGFSSSLRLAPVQTKTGRLQTAGCRRLVVRSTKQDVDISEKIEKAVEVAKESCAGNEGTGECAAAWDEVEELSAARAHKAAQDKANNVSDPLEVYCKDNPETDECRIYSD